MLYFGKLELCYWIICLWDQLLFRYVNVFIKMSFIKGSPKQSKVVESNYQRPTHFWLQNCEIPNSWLTKFVGLNFGADLCSDMIAASQLDSLGSTPSDDHCSETFFSKLVHSRPLFLYFHLFNTVQIQLIVHKIANDWIRTSDLWRQKWPLYQPRHNYWIITANLCR